MPRRGPRTLYRALSMAMPARRHHGRWAAAQSAGAGPGGQHRGRDAQATYISIAGKSLYVRVRHRSCQKLGPSLPHGMAPAMCDTAVRPGRWDVPTETSRSDVPHSSPRSTRQNPLVGQTGYYAGLVLLAAGTARSGCALGPRGKPGLRAGLRVHRLIICRHGAGGSCPRACAGSERAVPLVRVKNKRPARAWLLLHAHSCPQHCQQRCVGLQ